VTTDQKVQVLTFSAGMIPIVLGLLAALPNIDVATKSLAAAAIVALGGVIDLALFVFFKVKKPIDTALYTPVPDDK
jgi:hypothetical protein